MIFHVGADISGLLKLSTKKLEHLFNMPGQKARQQLEDARSIGHTVIKSSSCDHFDPFVHGCLGHTEDGKKNPCKMGKWPGSCDKTCDKCEFCDQEIFKANEKH